MRSRRVRAWLCGALVLLGAVVQAAVIEPRNADFVAGSDRSPPGALDSRWLPTRLPDAHAAPVVWYRIAFDRPSAQHAEAWMLYLPYLYGGGEVWLNGELVAAVQESTEKIRVSWERPQLLSLPVSSLRIGPNVMHIRTVRAPGSSNTRLSSPAIGPQTELQPAFDRRLFWVRTVPSITVAACVGVGSFFLLVWWRRRDEALYGLFGLAALLWAMRTNTFVFDAWPAGWWPAWRLVQHASTGGFVVVLALFSLSLAGWYRRRMGVALVAYWLIGPVMYVLAGSRGEEVISYWGPGLIVIGLGLLFVTAAAAWRQRTYTTLALAGAMCVAVATGVHDYVMAWETPWLAALAPDWTDQRIFLLHHGANVLLVVMAISLSSRFVHTLGALEDMNRTLEARVAEREREIADGYERLATLQREHAASEERQRIMQDLHDGLGSQLLISLLKVERGALATDGVADMLRRCIADMRLVIEAFASDEKDFRTALGNFLFRWEGQLREAGIASSWQIEAPDESLALSPHTSLQVLRVLQEALTNVVKHAQASHVWVRLTQMSDALMLEIEDNGRGFGATVSQGRGLANMRARAARLGARLETRPDPGATRISLALPAATG